MNRQKESFPSYQPSRGVFFFFSAYNDSARETDHPIPFQKRTHPLFVSFWMKTIKNK